LDALFWQYSPKNLQHYFEMIPYSATVLAHIIFEGKEEMFELEALKQGLGVVGVMAEHSESSVLSDFLACEGDALEGALFVGNRKLIVNDQAFSPVELSRLYQQCEVIAKYPDLLIEHGQHFQYAAALGHLALGEIGQEFITGLNRAFPGSEPVSAEFLEHHIQQGWEVTHFVDRRGRLAAGVVTLNAEEVPFGRTTITAEWIGYLYVSEEFQGGGFARSLLEYLKERKPHVDLFLADVVSPYSLCPSPSDPAHDLTHGLNNPARSDRWISEFGQAIDPYHRLQFWLSNSFEAPLVDYLQNPRLAPFEPIPVDADEVFTEDHNKYIWMVQCASSKAEELFASSKVTLADWNSLRNSFIPEELHAELAKTTDRGQAGELIAFADRSILDVQGWLLEGHQ
jgi:GNAT superfamily N-acetyltransferase